MKSNYALFFLFFFSFSTYIFSQSNIRYVTPNGGGDGSSISSTWTIQEAFTNATEGETIYIRRGDYGNVQIVQHNDGTQNNPIKFIGVDNNWTPISDYTDRATYTQTDLLDGSILPFIDSGLQPGQLGTGTGIFITGDYIHLRNIGIRGFARGLSVTGNHCEFENINQVYNGVQDQDNSSVGWGPTTYLGQGINNQGLYNKYSRIFQRDSDATGIQIGGGYGTWTNIESYTSKNVNNSMDYQILIESDYNIIKNVNIRREKGTLHKSHGLVFKPSNGTARYNTVDGVYLENTKLEFQATTTQYNHVKNLTMVSTLMSSEEQDEDFHATEILISNGPSFNTISNALVYNATFTIFYENWDEDYANDGDEAGNDNTFINIIGIKPYATHIGFNERHNNSNSIIKNAKHYNCTFIDGGGLFYKNKTSGLATGGFYNCIFKNIGIGNTTAISPNFEFHNIISDLNFSNFNTQNNQNIIVDFENEKTALNDLNYDYTPTTSMANIGADYTAMAVAQGKDFNGNNRVLPFTVGAVEFRDIDNCGSILKNLNTAMQLNNRSNINGLVTNGNLNGSLCEIQMTSPQGNPWSRHNISINLANYGINSGDIITISIDGKSESGRAQMQVVKDDSPNTSLLTKSFGNSWSTKGGEIVVPENITTLDIWLFSNFNDSQNPGESFYRNLNVTFAESAPICASDIENLNTALPLINRATYGNISYGGVSDDSLCKMQLISGNNDPWARYMIPIDLVAENISAGDQITISIDGKSDTGNARIEVNRDNTANTYLAENTFGSSWSNYQSTFTVPANISTLDIWLFSNFNRQNSPGQSSFRNLNISVIESIPPCTDDIVNQNSAMPLENRVSYGNISINGHLNGQSCEMQLISGNNDPWARYMIPIDLVAENISAGDQITISIDGKSDTGNARIEVNRDNTANTYLAENTFGSSWSNYQSTFTVPANISTLDIWLFSNFNRQNSIGQSSFRNLIVSKVTSTSFKAKLKELESIFDNQLEDISVFPNPAVNNLQIMLPYLNNYQNYNLYSLDGSLVKKGSISLDQKNISIEVHDLEEGLYLLNIFNDSGENRFIKVLKD